MEVDREKGSPGIICILEKRGKWGFGVYWNGWVSSEQKQTAKFQRFQTVQRRKQWFWSS